MIMMYIKEFVAITDFLRNSEKIKVHKGFVLVEKSILEELLNKNAFDTANNKLKTWKALHWISAEDRRVTKRVWNGELKRYQPYVKIYISVQEAIKPLLK